MRKKDENNHLKTLAKESPRARKERASSGVKFRPAVFKDKKKHSAAKRPGTRELLEKEAGDILS